MLLGARAEGVWASFLNQPIEVPELRPRLRDAIGQSGFPQLLLRMGYGPEVRPTPRWPAEEASYAPSPTTPSFRCSQVLFTKCLDGGFSEVRMVIIYAQRRTLAL